MDRKFLILDRETLKVVAEKSYPKELREGWGLTNNDQYLFASDGSNMIFKLDPNTL